MKTFSIALIDAAGEVVDTWTLGHEDAKDEDFDAKDEDFDYTYPLRDSFQPAELTGEIDRAIERRLSAS